jgi:hypothetical protein
LVDERTAVVDGCPKLRPLEYEEDRGNHQPFKLDDVRGALIDIGVEGVTVSEVKMLGRHAVRAGISGGGEYYSELMPKQSTLSEELASRCAQW